jgi:hypothetical protein
MQQLRRALNVGEHQRDQPRRKRSRTHRTNTAKAQSVLADDRDALHGGSETLVASQVRRLACGVLPGREIALHSVDRRAPDVRQGTARIGAA